ncbi:MAG: amidohydrolase [Chitinophagaceae bacterium]|nr:amidohydrolase [Chitinophagaceae bacterium]
MTINLIRSVSWIVLVCASCLSSCSNGKKGGADTVIVNATVYTADSLRTSAEALAIKDGIIVYAGTNDSARLYIDEKTEVIDAEGKFVMPGFIEGHGHIHGLGDFLRDINLMTVANWDEALQRLDSAIKLAKPGEWIIGRGWHQEKWDKTPLANHLGYPYKSALDSISPNNPVMLTHASGHSVYVNSKALEIAGVNEETPNPDGGDIVKDPAGNIVGVLEETAMGLVRRPYSEYVRQQTDEQRKEKWRKGIELAENDCLRKGITSFVDAGSSFEQMVWMEDLAAKGQLQIRHWMMLRESLENLKANKAKLPLINAGNGFLTVKAVKVSLDGALGSYGAWLLAPYTDRLGFFGQNTFPMDSLKAIAGWCWDNGLQLCVHAIGDRANRETVNIFAEQIAKDKSRSHRWRVEHAQHVHPAEIPRFKEWGIIASMQGIHCTSDAPFAPKRLGNERCKTGAYMWKSFWDAGVLVNNGTDAPVEDADPIANFYATVTRKGKSGIAFYPEERLSREQALYSYTMANAIAQFEEKEKGSLVPGKYADIVMLSNNLLTCGDEEILGTKILMTMVGGKVKYRQ